MHSVARTCPRLHGAGTSNEGGIESVKVLAFYFNAGLAPQSCGGQCMRGEDEQRKAWR